MINSHKNSLEYTYIKVDIFVYNIFINYDIYTLVLKY